MDFVMKLKADFLKALAHPTRLRVLEVLRDREVPVGELAKKLEVEQSILSKHLLLMKQAGVLTSRQQRTTVFYRLHNQSVNKILGITGDILRGRLAEGKALLRQLGKTK